MAMLRLELNCSGNVKRRNASQIVPSGDVIAASLQAWNSDVLLNGHAPVEGRRRFRDRG
jgi:hypothetical protein